MRDWAFPRTTPIGVAPCHLPAERLAATHTKHGFLGMSRAEDTVGMTGTSTLHVARMTFTICNAPSEGMAQRPFKGTSGAQPGT
jgi:hypothetical protein